MIERSSISWFILQSEYPKWDLVKFQCAPHRWAGTQVLEPLPAVSEAHQQGVRLEVARTQTGTMICEVEITSRDITRSATHPPQCN